MGCIYSHFLMQDVHLFIYRMSNQLPVRRGKRSLFAGRASPQPLEVFPGPVRKRVEVRSVYAPTMLPERLSPMGQRPAGVGGERVQLSGAVPFSASWLHTPVPLKWKPALILQLVVGDAPHLAIPIPWYAINNTPTPP